MEVRDQLLEAAIRVINEHGWAGATTRRIADAAGVHEVTLFRHFGSKDALIREAMCWYADRTPIATLPDTPGDAAAELTTWARQYYTHVSEARGHIRRSIGECENYPEQIATRPAKRLHEGLERYLARLRERGVVSNDWDVRTAACLLIGTLFADAIGRDFIKDYLPEPAEEAPDRYVQLFLRAIGYSGTSVSPTS